MRSNQLSYPAIVLDCGCKGNAFLLISKIFFKKNHFCMQIIYFFLNFALSLHYIYSNYATKNDMDKNKITVEHLLNSTSKNIIWQLIGTDSGLQKWIADSVTLDGDQLTCAWGDANRHHEVRMATVSVLEKFGRIRWSWDDETDGSYVEIRMEKSNLTGGYMLSVTDFTDDGDKEWLMDIWTSNFERLRRRCGV